jgi:uncharacterized glyoxalase superfamily protein PhnB
MLSVRNGARAVEFYKAAFGAIEIYRVEDPGGAVMSRPRRENLRKLREVRALSRLASCDDLVYSSRSAMTGSTRVARQAGR